MNDSRLSHSGDESLALELKSRDVIQFGVNVNVEKRGRRGGSHTHTHTHTYTHTHTHTHTHTPVIWCVGV